MNELYLIAHKVCGERAFDIAEQMPCPECKSRDNLGCAECDLYGYWWIIPTSGHRAYPYWHYDLQDVVFDVMEKAYDITDIPSVPTSLPDHYRHGPAPKVDIRALFKKSDWVPAPEAFIKRRL